MIARVRGRESKGHGKMSAPCLRVLCQSPVFAGFSKKWLASCRLFSVARGLNVYYYTDKHEWIHVDNGKGTVGISSYAQEQLGEIVYVETPEVGAKLAANDVAGCLESVKAASEVYNPVGGVVAEVNTKLTEQPNLVNSSPLQDGWLYKLTLGPATSTAHLMNEEAYKKYVGTLDGH